MVSTQFSATQRWKDDVNCFYAHHLMTDGSIEQLGFSESFMHCRKVSSDEHAFTSYQKNEQPISPEIYQEMRSIILDFLSDIEKLFYSPALLQKTDISIGNTYIYNNRVGKILHIRGESVYLAGIQKNNPFECSAFLTSYQMEEINSDTFKRTDPSLFETIEIKREETLQKLLSLLP